MEIHYLDSLGYMEHFHHGTPNSIVDIMEAQTDFGQDSLEVDVRSDVSEQSSQTFDTGQPNFGAGGVESQISDNNLDDVVDPVGRDDEPELF